LRYRLAIFDFDGTLADSFSWHLRVVNQIAEKYGIRRLYENDIETIRGFDARKAMSYVGLPMWKLPLIQREMQQRMTREIDQISLFPGVEELLHRLNANRVELAIVTSNSFGNVHSVLGPKTAGLIRHYACGASIFGKRAKLRRVLRSSGFHSSEAIFIGDEIRDLHQARAERIPFGAVSWGFNSIDSLKTNSPDQAFVSIEEIIIYLSR
jgi:phosphoglycolate phosphatase